jgi:hypothetical protein
MKHTLKRIISGGQTGVDQAALDAALELGISIGGYCPKGRVSEAGLIPERFPLTETESEGYAGRTEKNVKESDGTLILDVGRHKGGTRFTLDLCKTHGKPVFLIQLNQTGHKTITRFVSWLQENEISTLNVAGPRESKSPGIYEKTRRFLIQTLSP